MASISSLLKSAQSRAQKIQDQEDALVAYDYQLSPKTYDDFTAYTNYLNNRLNSTSDPSKALTYSKTINSAQTSYISNEIQRQTIDVMEGAQDNRAKYGKMVDLYYQAANSGNYDLAQSLRQQLDSLSITIQNEDAARVSASNALNGTMSALRAANLQDAQDKIKQYMKDVGSIYAKGGTDTLKQYNKELGLNANATIFDTLANLAQAAVGTYQAAIASETDPAKIRQYQTEMNGFLGGNSIPLPGVKDGISFQDIQDQLDANRVGEAVFREVNTPTGLQYSRNKTTGFVWGRDEQGDYRQIPLYNANTPSSGVKSTVDKKTGQQNFYSAQDLLKMNNFDFTNDNGTISFRNTGQIPGFYGSPFPTGENIQVTVGPNGELQIGNGQDLYNLQFDEKGNYTGLQRYLPSAITQVNGNPDENGIFRGQAKFNSRFLATQDLSRFTPDMSALVGIIDPTLAEAYRTKVANFNLVHGTNLPVTPTNFLQTNFDAGQIQNAQHAQYVQPVAPAPIVQPAAAPPIQAPALNPFTLPANPLKVVNATPQKITSVGVAQPGQITSVGNNSFTGNLRVF